MDQSISGQQADAVVKMRKVVSASVSWKSHSRNTYRLETKALVIDTNEIVVIKGYIGKTNYSFALLYDNTPIRKYTKHERHNWNGKDIRAPHKHTWNEYSMDNEVYIPKDIDPNSSISDQFIAFCNECNIELNGGYQPIMIQ